eukprot:COSAG01_NODE_1270_length_10961_cov_34.289423_15_plen_78_part_00
MRGYTVARDAIIGEPGLTDPNMVAQMEGEPHGQEDIWETVQKTRDGRLRVAALLVAGEPDPPPLPRSLRHPHLTPIC